MGKMSRLGNALYEGDVSIDFIGRKWLWYTISGIIVILAVGGLYFKGLNFGIEFEGGVEYTVSVQSGQATRTTWTRSGPPSRTPASTRPPSRS